MKAQQIVEENFKGLDEFIKDKDILYFYKSLIVTCMEGFTEEVLDELANQSQEMLYERNKDEKVDGMKLRDFQVCYAVSKQTILEFKDKL